MNADIMKSLTGTTSAQLKNEQSLLSDNPSSYTATFSGVNKVYNLFPGTVLFLGYYKGMGTVTVQVSPYELIRYLNISDIPVWYNQEIGAGTYLGTADKHFGLQLEYCTGDPDTSKFPLRINNIAYYKQNPINILDGLYTPEQRVEVIQGLLRPQDTVKFTSDESIEWGGELTSASRYIDTDAYQVTELKNIPKSALYMLSDNGGGK